MEKQKPTADSLARIGLGVALAASAAFLFHYRHEIDFVADDWWFIRDRSSGGIDTLLAPHSEHIAFVPVILYRLSFALFGLESAIPLHVLSLAVFLASVVAFFVYLRDQIGEPAAALVSIAILFMGTAYHDLLWTFQIGYSLSILFGLVALIALDREERWSRPAGCLALLVAVTSSSLGLPFMVGAAVQLFCREGLSIWRNYVLLVPSLTFLLWYFVKGTEAESYVSFENALGIPAYLYESLEAVATGLAGIHALPSPFEEILGIAAVLVVVAAVSTQLWRTKSLPVQFLVGLAAGLTFWVLIALNQPDGIGRPADLSRYQYPGAIFLIMIIAGAFTGSRLKGKGLAALGTLVAVALVAGLSPFSEGAKLLRTGADYSTASITALGLAGERAVPEGEVTLVPFFDLTLRRDRYLSLESRYGLPEFSEEEIPGLDGGLRSKIDVDLMNLLGLGLKSGPAASRDCRTIPAGTEVPAATTTGGRFSFRSRSSGYEVRASRFAPGTLTLGRGRAGETRTLTIPPDDANTPWRIFVTSDGPVRFCESGKGT